MNNDFGDSVEREADLFESQLPNVAHLDDELQAHLVQSRWWFASSAFPMMAGTLGPVASAFSICSLVRPWRQIYPPGSNVADAEFIPDPAWLTIVNAIQLVVALISNMFLLLNMARRVRFSIAQPVTIVGWYISSICLIALAATAAGPLLEGLDPANNYIWSQAYYYGVWAAILYFIDASLMLTTFFGALSGHYPKDFNLSRSQRTLMLQTIMFLMYLLIGALIFSRIEGWNYLDGVYWADVTLFTVGFGDYAPTTKLGRALLMPFALVGIISLGLVIGSIRSLMLERGKRQMDARMEERTRRRTVRTLSNSGRDALLEPIRSATNLSLRDPDRRMPTTELERRNAEFNLMRKIQRRASTRRKWVAMAMSTGTWLVLWLVGAYVFYRTEQPYQSFWSYYDSVYFCFVSLLTIGYGDLTPVSNAGKSFFVFWSLLALPTVTVLISSAGDTVIKAIRDGTLRLGNVTILPGEAAFMAEAKHILNEISCGYLCRHHNDPVPTSSTQHLAQENDGPAWPDHQEKEGRTSGARHPTAKLPVGPDYHYLLIAEIESINKHLRHKKAYTYSFEEWAWYLKLVGEDEGKPDTHHKPTAKSKKLPPNTDHSNNDVPEEDPDGGPKKWSWVGYGSPLLGGHEESEWILDRLTSRLKECLAEERKLRQKKEARRRAEKGSAVNTGHGSGSGETN